jgi:glycosyltransferase 2 family protein
MPSPAAGAALKSRLRQLPAVLGVLLLIGAIYIVQCEFRYLRLRDIGRALGAIPPHALALSFGWTILSYFVLTFYDLLGTIYAGHKVRYGRVAFASFCAYALSHNIGFAAVSGAAVRYRLYAHWGLTPTQIAKTVAFCSLTFGLGGMVLGGAILLLEPRSMPFLGSHLPVSAAYVAGALLWGIVAAYITLSRIVGRFQMFGHEIDLPGFRMAVLQVLLATVDVAVTATVFWQLLPAAPGLTWLVFLGIYVCAYTAGLATNLPGGIGVFDTAILLGLRPYIDAPRIVGAIIVFRLYYYVIPLFLAGTLFSANEIVLRGESLWRRAARSPTVQAIGRWSEPDFAVASATGSVALCGVLLLCLGVLAPQADYAWLDPDVADLANQAGQFVPSLIGAGLVMMAIGLSQRVNLAWRLTLFFLVIGAAFAAAQTDRLWVAAVLTLTALLVVPFRSCFYRHARLLSGPLDPAGALSLFVLAICLLALAATRPYTGGLANNAWWAVVVSRTVPNSLRVAVAMAVIFGLIAIWRLLRPGRVRWLPWDTAARGRLAALGVIPPRRADGLVLGESERAGVPFRRCGRVLLGLGDPSGAQTDRVSAIWRLRDLAHQEGLDPAFWRAGPELLKVYGDIGLTALPLGPDGLPLPEAPDETPAAPHYLVCVAERDLGTLLPLLPELASDQDVAISLAA